MDAGRVAQVGSPRDIYLHPGSAFVANFIGTTNLVAATIEEVSPEGIRVMTPDGPLLSLDIGRQTGKLRECFVSIRPEAVRLSSEADQTGKNSFPGDVGFKRHVGELIEYYIKTRSGQEIIASYQTGTEEFFEGDRVTVTLKPESCLLLDRAQQ
jgi:ABC-type Fe3+/spermidine/putrescine transport system ATPase subunit